MPRSQTSSRPLLQDGAEAAEGSPSDRELLERFLKRKEEAAFEALVHRYGPMVLSVCRRILSHLQDAEDAFQATFLILVRKAWSIGNPELLGSWLYGVAYRVASKARLRAAKRREQEKQAEPVAVAPPVDPFAWKELQSALDRELNRLPAKYRHPLVLCYLQGMTNEEAARRLGWPAGSISYRLARGREMLRDRMTGRDEEASPASVALLLALGAAGGRVPGRLVEITVQSAAHIGAGKLAAAPGVSTAVRSMMDGTLRTMPGSRGKVVAAVLIVILLAALAWGRTGNTPPPEGSGDENVQTMYEQDNMPKGPAPKGSCHGPPG